MGLISGIKQAIKAHMTEKEKQAERERKKRIKKSALRKRGYRTKKK
jgi:hypothetical protein